MEEEVKNENEDRNVEINSDSPEILTNPIYTPAFLRQQIGKLMRVEFLIGTNNLTDRIGILQDVGASYILLRSFENDSLVYADLYAIKFITISTTSSAYNMQNPNFPNYNMPNFNEPNCNIPNRYMF